MTKKLIYLPNLTTSFKIMSLQKKYKQCNQVVEIFVV